MARWGDTYTLTADADVGGLDKAVDALRDTADATERVGDVSDRMADDVRNASRELAGVDGNANKARGGMKGFGDESEKTGGILSKLGGIAGGVFKTLAGFTGLGALGFSAVFGAALTDFNALDTAMNKYQAQTGTRDWQMDGLEQAVESLYTDNLGDGFDDIAASMATVRSITQNWDPAFLQDMTGDALILRDVFDYDVNESVRAANQLMTQFGEDGGDAFDMITRASQFYGDAGGDLLDTVNEYSSTFQDMGFTAEEMMSILGSGVNSGAYNYDVVADSIREMNIRLQDGTADLSLWSMGLDGMKRQWADGEVSAGDFFGEVINGLNDIEDSLKRQQAGVALFGTKWEDIGDQVYLSLDTYSDAFYDMEDATAAAGDVMARGLQPAVTKFTRTLRVGLTNALSPYIEAFVRQMIPALETFGVWLQNVGLPWLSVFFGQIATGVQSVIAFAEQAGIFDTLGDALMIGADYAGQLVEFITGMSPESVIALVTALGIMAGPAVIGAVVAGLTTIVGMITGTALANPAILLALAGIAAYETNFGGMRDALDGMVAAFKDGDLAGGFSGLASALLAIPKGIASEVGGALFGWDTGEMQTRLDKWKEIPGMIGEIGSKLGELGAERISGFADSFTSSVVDPIKNGISGAVAAIFGGGSDRNAGTSLKAAFSTIPTMITNALIGLGTTVITSLYDPFVGVVADIVGLFFGEENAESFEAKMLALPGKIAEWTVAIAEAGGDLAQGFVDAFSTILGTLTNIVINAINDAIPDEIDLGDTPTFGIPGLESYHIAFDLPDDPIKPPSRDRGGDVKAGASYWVGKEAQPELFVPSSDGVMIPNGRLAAMGAGGGGDMIFNGDLYFNGVQNIKELAQQLAQEKKRTNKHGGRD